MRHTLGVGMPKARQAKESFDHMGEAFPGRHFHAHTSVSVTRIPPVVPHVRFDRGGLSLTKDARLSAALHSQFTLEDREAFDHPRMAVFANDPRSNKREQLRCCAAVGVMVGKLKDCRALASDRVFPNLADLDGS